jgi:hypothetical protein
MPAQLLGANGGQISISSGIANNAIFSGGQHGGGFSPSQINAVAYNRLSGRRQDEEGWGLEENQVRYPEDGRPDAKDESHFNAGAHPLNLGQ